MANELDVFIGREIIGSFVINAKHKAPVQLINIYFNGIIININNNALV
jgi:hypothetical protein